MHASTRFSSLVLGLVAMSAAACGDDGTGTGGAGTGGGTTATSTSTAATSSSSSSAAGTGGDDATTGTGGDDATTGAGGAGGASAAACLPADVVDLLQAHLDAMSLSAELMAGHPGPQEATSFLVAPALPEPPAIGAQFASLFQPCDGEAFDYDAFCDGGLCSRIGCTGAGAGWSMTAWSAEPVENDGFAIEVAATVTTWAEDDTGTGVGITYAAVGPDGRDWSFVGEGRFEADGVSLSYTFDAWVDGHGAEMTWSVNPDGTTGAIVSGGVTVASIGEDGHFEPTGDCPR